MKMRKFAASALALAAAAAICAPVSAFAAELNDSTTIPDNPNVTATDGTADSVITGTIKATTLSVSVPTQAAFTIDPDATVAANGGQFTSPTNYAITNKSVVPVYAYVSKVQATGVALVDAAADVKAATSAGAADAAVMFAVKDAAPTNFDTKTDWLTATANKYFAFNADENGKLDAKGGTKPAATMKFYGQAPSTNWNEDQTFTITPTFTISATAPSAS